MARTTSNVHRQYSGSVPIMKGVNLRGKPPNSLVSPRSITPGGITTQFGLVNCHESVAVGIMHTEFGLYTLPKGRVLLISRGIEESEIVVHVDDLNVLFLPVSGNTMKHFMNLCECFKIIFRHNRSDVLSLIGLVEARHSWFAVLPHARGRLFSALRPGVVAGVGRRGKQGGDMIIATRPCSAWRSPDSRYPELVQSSIGDYTVGIID